MRIPGPETGRDPRFLATAALVVWAAAVSVLAALPEDSGRALASAGLYWGAAAFAAAAIARAAALSAGSCRRFWALLGSGLLFRALGDADRMGLQLPGIPHWSIADAASCTLLFVALLLLVSRVTHRTTLVAAVDALFITISVGLLVWHFVLGESMLSGIREAAAISAPVCNAGLLYLALVALSTRHRPAFAGLLAAAFTLFLLADTAYLRLRAAGVHEPGSWPEPVWALGIGLIGLAALRATGAAEFASRPAISPWRVGAFWFGPLSPAMHYGFLLAWVAATPPVPLYVLVWGVALMFYLAFRISFVSYVSQQLRREQEELARRSERNRISEDLHDTLKQSIHGAALLIGAYRNARRSDPEAAGEILDRAVEATREADYLVSRPINELHALSGMPELDGETVFRQVLEEVRERFDLRLHEDLAASPNELPPERLAAAYRIVSEALWNAGRHSGARNAWLETRKVGSVFIVRVRDDGRGLPAGDLPWGIGISLMHSRAESAGGKLDIVSRPGGGTTVQVRFEQR
ncbi:hypothetical protein E0L93_00060 [Rubrobacter taiwanensis]|uniref:Histidine kinase domain-containing protein n=1 Tax=Rubrobacter taiwanensis TaxID=185139 RepID=A0A4V2NXB8_9ACTN|nr:ATP-binding protein [Rubrobacter taiwanensis]TCJ20662.1 hypothetical protein E0L93_00060 [Rubrobacter taiwanensis]